MTKKIDIRVALIIIMALAAVVLSMLDAHNDSHSGHHMHSHETHSKTGTM